MNEPLLTAEDRRMWATIEHGARARARTRAHGRLLDAAKRTVEDMAARCPRAYVGWSAGKDSTVLTHLVCVELGIDAEVMSIKDALDFPGERAYVERWGKAWKLQLHVIEPEFDLGRFLAEYTAAACPGDDLHGRASTFSQRAFYALIDAFNAARGCGDVYLGLRAQESRARWMNYRQRGALYTVTDASGLAITKCQPLVHWPALDVYAYLMSRDIPLFDVYRCVRLVSDPLKIRKSWWFPGSSACHGHGVWLRTYYPSLWLQLCEIAPGWRRIG